MLTFPTIEENLALGHQDQKSSKRTLMEEMFPLCIVNRTGRLKIIPSQHVVHRCHSIL